MNLASNLAVLLLAVGLFLPTARAGDQRPIVAVFDIQTKYIKLPKGKRDMLTDLMASELAQGGIYRVMPPGDVKRVLLEQSRESYKECFDEKCQIELGRYGEARQHLEQSLELIPGDPSLGQILRELERYE